MLMTGQTLSHYRILGKVGEDPAGVLYKAVDTRDEKPCAVKILSPLVVENPGVREIIVREATAISALNHPNIARVLEWGRQDASEFAVMEAPEGESLQDFLDRERPQRRILLRFTNQIASALKAAHDAGFVHGPLNPAAMLVTPRNEIRIYDFGFGALDAPAASEQARRAQFGAAVPYVSPEQALGERPDTRSDIFSYGALVYHLTAGRAPFRGETIAATWKEIAGVEPRPVKELTSRVPRGMDKLIERCLRKNPEKRLQRMDEVEPLLEKTEDAYRQNPGQASLLARYGGRIAKIAAAGVAVSAVVAAAVIWWQSRPKPEPVIGTGMRQLTNDSGLAEDPALTPDGTRVAYASDRSGQGNLDIWVQPVEGGAPTQLTNDPSDDREPVFSPDGKYVAFRSERNGGGIFTIPMQGGGSQLIAAEGRRPRYSPDGRWIAYWVGPPGLSPKAAGAYKVFIVPASGGEPKQIQGDFASCTYPIWSPDSKAILLLGRPDASRNGPGAIDWWLVPIDGHAGLNTGACKLFHRLGILNAGDVAIPGDWKGTTVYFSFPSPSGSNIWQATLTPGSWTVEGDPVKVTSGKGIETMPNTSGNGLLVYSDQKYNADVWSLPLAANEGRVTGRLSRRTTDPGLDVVPSLSGDGKKLLFQSNRSGHYNMMLLDTSTGKEAPVAPSSEDQLWPLISPDGSKVAWSERRLGRYELLYRTLGKGSPEVLCGECGPAVSGWSKDGKMALVDSFNRARTRLTVSVTKMNGNRPSLTLEDPASDARAARFSPDGKRILFGTRIDGGATRLYVAPFHDEEPTPQSAWIALTDGNGWESSPNWSPDGKLVYYVSSRDGYRCVWAQSLDPSSKPNGAPFAVFHLHGARLMPAGLPFNHTDLFVAGNQILLSLGDRTGNVWSAKLSQH